MFNTVTAIKMKRRIEKIHRNRFIIRGSKKQLEYGIVIEINIFVKVIIFRNASGNITFLLVNVTDFLKHACVLFFIHKEAFAFYSSLFAYVTKHTRALFK